MRLLQLITLKDQVLASYLLSRISILSYLFVTTITNGVLGLRSETEKRRMKRKSNGSLVGIRRLLSLIVLLA
jgi:hypothetical protein